MKRISNLVRGEEYLSPTIEIAEFVVEAGFAVSGTGSAGWEDGNKENDLGDF